MKALSTSFKYLAALLLVVFIIGCMDSKKPDTKDKLDIKINPSELKTDIPYIDAHNHLFGGKDGRGFYEAATHAVTIMDELNIKKMIIMPPPQAQGFGNRGTFFDLFPAVQRYPGRFACLGGGGSLNIMIHQNKHRKVFNRPEKNRFRQKAELFLSKGAVGFGEFTGVHFSFANDHPFHSVSADHPLFLFLADIAADHNVPIDIHNEAVLQDMAFPSSKKLERSRRNPSLLLENMAGFENLLKHNRKAKIIWAHSGWCNTGDRTAELSRTLLSRNPNLYMSIKLRPGIAKENKMLNLRKRIIPPQWLALLQDFPDRFIIGTDQFYSAPGGKQLRPQTNAVTQLFMNTLPPDLAKKIGMENPSKLFNFQGVC